MFEAYESLPGLLKMDFQCKFELTYTHKCLLRKETYLASKHFHMYG